MRPRYILVHIPVFTFTMKILPNFPKTYSLAISRETFLFWLDAHWCVADETAGGISQCPSS